MYRILFCPIIDELICDRICWEEVQSFVVMSDPDIGIVQILDPPKTWLTHFVSLDSNSTNRRQIYEDVLMANGKPYKSIAHNRPRHIEATDSNQSA